VVSHPSYLLRTPHLLQEITSQLGKPRPSMFSSPDLDVIEPTPSLVMLQSSTKHTAYRFIRRRALNNERMIFQLCSQRPLLETVWFMHDGKGNLAAVDEGTAPLQPLTLVVCIAGDDIESVARSDVDGDCGANDYVEDTGALFIP
jgi:hypothetical protein